MVDSIVTHHRHMHKCTAEQSAMMAQLRSELVQVDAALKCTGDPGVTEQCAWRWLTARKWDYAAAKNALITHSEWRTQNVQGSRIADEVVQSQLEEKKVFVQGLDSMGHPITIVKASKHKPKSAEETSKLISYSMDACCQLGATRPTWDGKITAIMYLTGMTMSNYDFAGLKAVFDMLQNHYPETLYRFYLYDAPMVFIALWKCVSPFIDPVTRQKVVFVIKQSASRDMLQVIPAEMLPQELQGTAPWRPAQDLWAKLESVDPPRALSDLYPSSALKALPATAGCEDERDTVIVADNGMAVSAS